MKLIGNILRWIWRTFWGLVWLSMVLLACGLGLLFYFQQEAAPQMLQTLAQEVQLMVKGQSEVTIEEGVNTIKHLRLIRSIQLIMVDGKAILRLFTLKPRIQHL